MADTQTTLDEAAPQDAATVRSITVPVTKAKSTVEIVLADIPDDVYQEALALGLKELVNRGMSKLTKAAFKGNEAELAEACMKVAETNLDKIKSSEIKFAGKKAKAKGLDKAVVTEAMRLAKALVKDAFRAQGHKLSTIKASTITAYAKAYLDEDGGELYAQATATLEERAKNPILAKVSAMSATLGPIEDPKLVAKAAAEKASKPLSAKQAGKVKGRQKKGEAAQATAH